MQLTSRGSYDHHHCVSKTLQYDSLLVRALVAALDERYAGARVRAIRFDAGTRTVRICFHRHALVWDLDPAGGGLWQEPERGVPAGVVMPRRTTLKRVQAAPDERIVEWVLESTDDASRRALRLWVELLPNRRNAILTGDGGRVLGSLVRVASASDRGPAVWTPPQGDARTGWDEPPERATWLAVLGEIDPASRERALLSHFAWTGPINAGPILGEARHDPDPDALVAAYDRYLELLKDDTPGILEPDSLDQPYPAPLPGIEFRETRDVLAAFDETAPMHRTRAGQRDPAAVLRTLERLRRGERSKIDRLRDELAGAGREAERLRANGDLLLAQLHKARRGMKEVVLEDWNGGEVRIGLDPALDPAANADRLYEKARKRERASERLPDLIARSETRLRRLDDAVRLLEADPARVEEVTGLLPAASPVKQRSPRGPALPYRRYRTSGGLEVRVGRGSRANDDLTLHHSRPDDIWLHARDVAGAHVVLRWDRRDENPPAAEVAEAAALAALHSRARTSGVVPVDWTRRKYVRKPRKAPPGQVLLERARTVFVEPDEALEKRLRHP